MDLFAFLTLFGGLAVFLYGMNVMGDALERSSGNRRSPEWHRPTPQRRARERRRKRRRSPYRR